MNIIITGGRASGKTLLMERLATKLRAEGKNVCVVDEPKEYQATLQPLLGCKGVGCLSLTSNLPDVYVLAVVSNLEDVVPSVLWKFDTILYTKGIKEGKVTFVPKPYWDMYDSRRL